MNAPKPDYPKSTLIKNVHLEKYRFHKGHGDMWPLTWADDNNIYAGAGDNMGSPMNFWKVIGDPPHPVDHYILNIDNLPIDPKIYCQNPPVDPKMGIKPASLICIKGIIYFAVEAMNFGDDPDFNRQHNINSWIITTKDYGQTWNKEATSEDFFTGRLASPHFLQFGKNYEGARDDYVYAYFPAADDGNSYWENGDNILLGRVNKEDLLKRDKWELYTGIDNSNNPIWNRDDKMAKPVFRYPRMTGENHVSFNKGLGRYIMGNYGFINKNGDPRPYHQGEWPNSVYPSQLSLFEAPEPWGPWSLFYIDDNWGTYGDYQPNFPTKWMSQDGKTMWMVSSGTFDDYNFTEQKIILELYK